MCSRGPGSRAKGQIGADRAGRPIELGLPYGLRRLIEARIERLIADERNLLEVASVPGVPRVALSSRPRRNLTPLVFRGPVRMAWRAEQVIRPRGRTSVPDGQRFCTLRFLHAVFPARLPLWFASRRPFRAAAPSCHSPNRPRSEHVYRETSGEIAPTFAHQFTIFAWLGARGDYLQPVAYTAAAAHGSGLGANASAHVAGGATIVELTLRQLAGPRSAALENRILRNLPRSNTGPRRHRFRATDAPGNHTTLSASTWSGCALRDEALVRSYALRTSLLARVRPG